MSESTNTDSSSEHIERAAAQIRDQGYTIVENFLSFDQLSRARELLGHRGLEFKGRNNFEGSKTERIYALLTQDRVFHAMPFLSVIICLPPVRPSVFIPVKALSPGIVMMLFTAFPDPEM
jgi:hypothetical protein